MKIKAPELAGIELEKIENTTKNKEDKMDNQVKFSTLAAQGQAWLEIVNMISSVMEADKMAWNIAQRSDSDMDVDISFGGGYRHSEHCQAICKPLCNELATLILSNNQRENVYAPVRPSDINNLQEFADTGVSELTHFVLSSVRHCLESRIRIAEQELARYE